MAEYIDGDKQKRKEIKKMQVVIVEPCTAACVKEIDGSLEAMQSIVGGRIESVPFEEKPQLCIVCNEEGKLLKLEDNFVNYDDIIVGTAFICKRGVEDFESLTDAEAEQVCEILNSSDERW